MTRQIDAASATKIKGFEGIRYFAYPDPASPLAQATPELAYEWGRKSAVQILATLSSEKRALSGVPWSVGYGHTGPDVTASTVWGQARCDSAFMEDILPAEQIVEDNVKVPLTDNEFGALVSFVYNVGYGSKGKKDGFVILKNGKPSTLLNLINSGNKVDVPKEMMKWANANGQPNAGLKNRRNAEGGMWVGGSFIAGSNVEPDPPTPFIKTKVGQALGTAAGSITIGSAVSGAQQLHDAAAQWHLPFWAFGLVAVVAILLVIFKAIKDE